MTQYHAELSKTNEGTISEEPPSWGLWEGREWENAKKEKKKESLSTEKDREKILVKKILNAHAKEDKLACSLSDLKIIQV